MFFLFLSFPLLALPQKWSKNARKKQLLLSFFRARAQQSGFTGGLRHFDYNPSCTLQSSLQQVRAYILLTAEGCNRLQALYSATQSFRLEKLAEARNKALRVGELDSGCRQYTL